MTWITLVGVRWKLLSRAGGLPWLPCIIANGGWQLYKFHPSWVSLLSHKRQVLISKLEKSPPELGNKLWGVTKGALEPHSHRNSSAASLQVLEIHFGWRHRRFKYIAWEERPSEKVGPEGNGGTKHLSFDAQLGSLREWSMLWGVPRKAWGVEVYGSITVKGCSKAQGHTERLQR